MSRMKHFADFFADLYFVKLSVLIQKINKKSIKNYFFADFFAVKSINPLSANLYNQTIFRQESMEDSEGYMIFRPVLTFASFRRNLHIIELQKDGRLISKIDAENVAHRFSRI